VSVCVNKDIACYFMTSAHLLPQPHNESKVWAVTRTAEFVSGPAL